MADEAKVLLVSSGEPPEGLSQELTRLGVEVINCTFADAEEALENSPPDLVTLAGARGAVELANIIDDMKNGPRMVVVAERRELAKLRGLNREVVVSLFAMETTEKVVGQRIESLARRAARRRQNGGMSLAPVQQKTSLGLPTAGAIAVGKVDLRSSSPPNRPAFLDESPLAPGRHPGAETGKEISKGEVLNEDRPGRPAPPRRNDAPAPPQRDEDAQSFQVLDEELLESLSPPGMPDGVTLSAIPTVSAIPEIEEAPVSHPPTLPPQVKAQAKGAEAGIDLFHSVKLELTEDLLDMAIEDLDSITGGPKTSNNNAETAQAKRTSDDEHASASVVDAPVPGLSSEEQKSGVPDEADEIEVISIAPGPPGAELEDGAPQPLEIQQQKAEFAFDRTMPLTASAPKRADERAAVPDVPLPAPAPERFDAHAATLEMSKRPELLVSPEADIREKRLPTEVVPAAMPPTDGTLQIASATSSKQSSGGGKGLLVAAIVLLGGGFAVFKSGVLSGDPGAKTSATSEIEKAKAPVVEAKNSAPDAVEATKPSQVPGSVAPPTQQAAAPVEPSVGEPSANQAEGQAATSQLAAAPTSSLSNPFLVADTKKPGCSVLLAGNTPVAGNDPISQASGIWAEARQAIVAAKLEQANLLMCQAVALNPESAAIEGLAQFYLGAGSTAEALQWVDKADAIRPNQLEMGNLRGDIYAFMGDVDKAREVWLRTLHIGAEEKSRIAPVSKDYSVEAGRHLRRGDYLRAEIFFRRAVILDGSNVNGVLGLAKVYQRLERDAYARAFAEMCLSVSDLIPEVHTLLGELALKQGNKAEAKQRFERALAIRSDFYPAKRGLSQVE